MNSPFTCISILVKSNVSKNYLINFLSEVSSQSFRSYLRLATIYDGSANKKKSDLIERIIYGCMNDKLRNAQIGDICLTKSHSILKEKNINVKYLLGYGNFGSKKKDLKPYLENEKCSIKLKD